MFGGGTKAGTAPPSSWRFHSSGFATGSNAEMAVVGRQPHNAAAASSSSTAFASTTTTTTTMDTTLLAPHPPGDHHLRGGGGGWGGGGANKRPLASCREELERGWHRHRCVSNDRVSSSWLADDDDDDDDDDEIITDDDDIADDGDMSSGNGNGNGNGNGRVKRRRISSPPIRDHAGGMMEGEEDAAAMMTTTATDDRESSSSSSSMMTWTDGSPSLVVTRRAVRIARRDPRRQVKAGWYDGPVDDYGNRHGRGTTRHDDGTTYEGPYANDVMAGSGGRYTLPARHELAGDGGNLLRRVEVRFEGSFRDDAPHGVGATITTTVDRAAPSAAGGRPAAGAEVASPAAVVVTYDVGVHDSLKSGGAVGEGARVAYRRIVRPPDDGFCHRPDADGGGGGGGGGGTGTTGGVSPPPSSSSSSSSSSSWERSCYRLINGRDAGMKVADGYAAWIVQCMGVDFPGPPSPLLLAPTSATPASS